MGRSPTPAPMSRALSLRLPRCPVPPPPARPSAEEERAMIGYYTRLAWNSSNRHPGIPVLMVLAIALGIAVCIMTLTVFHAMSGNPIWWKNDRLYAVTMDNWDPMQPFDKHAEGLPPPIMTYKDARYLARSDIPARKVIMYTTDG